MLLRANSLEIIGSFMSSLMDWLVPSCQAAVCAKGLSGYGFVSVPNCVS